MPDTPPSRRDFLTRSGQALGGAWLFSNLALVRKAAARAAEADRRQDAFVFLGADEARDLEAVAEQIMPATDTPGARDVGVIRFMDQALDSFAGEMVGPVRGGLEDLNGRVRRAHSDVERFSELGFAEQTALLEEIEDGPFFQTVRYLTVVGMFSLPRYGGNRDEKGWEVLGFDERPVWQPPFGYYDERYRRERDSGSEGAGGSGQGRGGADR